MTIRTWSDLVAYVAEDAAACLDENDIDCLLWEHTAFPFDTPSGIYRRLVVLRETRPNGLRLRESAPAPNRHEIPGPVVRT